MMKKTREQWKEVIEDQKASGLSIEKYCQQSHICVSSFYKYKSLIIKEESSFLPVVVDKDVVLRQEKVPVKLKYFI